MDKSKERGAKMRDQVANEGRHKARSRTCTRQKIEKERLERKPDQFLCCEGEMETLGFPICKHVVRERPCEPRRRKIHATRSKFIKGSDEENEESFEQDKQG